MKKQLKIIAKNIPSVNSYMTSGYRKTPDTKNFETLFAYKVKKAMEEQNWKKPPEGVFCKYECIHYFPAANNDSNNRYKVPMDILTKCGVWEDDRYAIEGCNRVYIDNRHPRTEIIITVMPWVGIFDNKKDFNTFEEKCKECKRYKRNCSILKDSKENKIPREFDKDDNNKWICNSYDVIKIVDKKNLKKRNKTIKTKAKK